MNISAHTIPMVIDNSDRSERAFDIYSLLLKERIVFLGSAINDQLANLIVAQLLYLNSQDSKKQIDLYIHSPGGSVYSGMAIYDTMKMISAPVSTVSVGFTGSMATALLTSGARGKRYALSHSTIHMHPTSGGAKGYTEDVRIATKEQERLQVQLFHILGKNTGHTWQEIEEMFLRDKFMNAPEALEMGLIDEVLGETNDILRINIPEVKVSLQDPSEN
ncbi:ClpP family protease [Membranihabitans maritimus]|uniref:ClpP family protease n=1 Tax=Membranihabitans maritimus TaxID=2904244 RepID=UPI001F348845|nr:ATP-dependent Clp protease proteolytic subunit [Membranihabitans maritimus]